MRDLGARWKTSGVLILLATMLGCQALSASQSAPQQPKGANLSLSDATLDFGSVAIGSNKTLSVTLVNGTSGTVTVTQAGANRPEFALSAPQLPVMIAAGQSSSLSITFAPAGAGASQATVSLSTDVAAEPLSLAVTGDGVNPGQLGADPSKLDFGVVPLGSKQTKPAMLTNVGGTSVTITRSWPAAAASNLCR